MAYCRHCRAELVKNARFCTNCCCPVDEETVIENLKDCEKDEVNPNLQIEMTESSDDFDEYKELLGIERPTMGKGYTMKSKKSFFNFIKFRKK